MGSDLMDSLAEPESRSRKKKRGISGFTVVGVLLLVLGLSCLGYIGYEYLGTNVVSEKQSTQTKDGLREEWASSPATQKPAGSNKGAPVPGDRIPGKAMGLLRIPRLGASYEVPIVAGTDASSLSKGVGWYESSVRPGDIGNFALAGHRITHGEPFARLLEVKKGDEVVVETREAVYTYVMDSSPADLTVDDHDTWVLDPVPGKKGAQPTQSLITLTTCQDLFHSADRSVGFGHLVSTKNK